MKCAHKFCNNEMINKRKGAKYCSPACQRRAKSARHRKRNPYPEQICNNCERNYTPTRNKQKYCSKKCYGLTEKKFLDIPHCLEDASRKVDKNLGYVRVYCPMHPKANTWGYVYEHRVIAEQMLGRYLKDGEIVHHKNHKRWDNRESNLEVMTSSEHSRVHAEEKRKRKKNERANTIDA